MRIAACFLCLLVCGPAAAVAQPSPLPDTRPPREELIERLGSPVFAAREQAAADLLERDDFTIDEAELELARPGLSPEQRLRLEQLALRIFRRGPRAALGIQFAPERGDAVLLERAVEGFDAATKLQAGDRIVEADGLKVTRQATLRAAILSHGPEETLHLVVVRDGERLEVSVRLGSFASLSGGVGPRDSDVLAAWNLRRLRDGPLHHDEPVTPTPIDAGYEKPEQGSPAWRLAYATGDAPAGLCVGGQARETADLSLTQLAAIDASRALTLEELGDVGRTDLAMQIVRLRDKRGLLLGDIERIVQLIEGPNLDAGGRAMMRRRLDEVRDELAVLEEQIRLLDEARRERP